MSDAAIVDQERDREEQSGAVDDRMLSVQAAPVTHFHEPPAWLNQAIQQLLSMRSLRENWDGYGAAAPHPDIVRSAEGFLHFLCNHVSLPAPFITPTRIGGVLFEWEQGPHQVEVDVCTPDAASYVYLNRETDSSISGSLFRDSADDGRFLEIARSFFAME